MKLELDIKRARSSTVYYKPSKGISFATEEDLVLSSIVVSFHIGHAFCHAPIEVVLVGGGAEQVLLVAIMNEGQHQKRQRQ